MLKDLLIGVVSGFAVRLLDNCRRLSVQLLRIEAAKSYIQGVRMARLSAIGLVRVGLAVAVIGLGAVLLHVGLFIVLPWTVEAKAILGMVLGLVYMVLGGLVLRSAMDERTWMAKSGAAKMLDEALRSEKGA